MSKAKKLQTIATFTLGVGTICLAAAAILLVFGKTQYIISFDSQGGNALPAQLVNKGNRIVKPIDPLKEGYTFKCWNYNNVEYDFDNKVSDNMILVANWEKEGKATYTITFKVDDITKTLEVNEASEIDLEKLGFEEKEGYELKWYLNDKEYDLETPITGNLQLVGKYVKIEKDNSSLTVKFNSNGGTTISSQTVKYGEKAKEPTNPTKEAFIFDGWYLNNQKYDFNSTVTKSITLVAKWNEDPKVKRYTVTFDSTGGSSVAKQRIIENKTATKPANPTKKDYVFVEWQLDNKAYDFKTKVTKDITLKAKWRDVNRYTVIFDFDNGSSQLSSTVAEGSTVSRPANPTKSGYTFKEWQLDGNTFDFKTKIVKNLYLKAFYTKNSVVEYTVTFNNDDGTKLSSQKVEAGGKVSKPSSPTKVGYTFKNWLLNENPYDFNSSVNNNITLVASYTKNDDSYRVKATSYDNHSGAVQVILNVWQGDTQISGCTIRYTTKDSEGHYQYMTECGGPVGSVTYNSQSSFMVELSDGTIVKAGK